MDGPLLQKKAMNRQIDGTDRNVRSADLRHGRQRPTSRANDEGPQANSLGRRGAIIQAVCPMTERRRGALVELRS
jgi:hypothetical protein